MCEVEEAGKKGWQTGVIMVLDTYNTVVEAATYKGNSSSEILFKFTFRLSQRELNFPQKYWSLMYQVQG